MNEDSFVLHGAVLYSKDRHTLVSCDDAYVVCVEGRSAGVFTELPEEYAELPIEDFFDKLILPGFTDLHCHAPQYQFRAAGLDLELLPWLTANAFPEEARYSDLEYAERAYDLFVEELYVGPTTRACLFATADPDATLILMDELEDTGLVSCVGKVNMDRNVPDYYVETTEESLEDTRAWLAAAAEAEYANTYPIITPRFTPSCTRELLTGLGEIAKEYGVPVQSHLSENLDEIEWVKQLESDTANYGESYNVCGLFGAKDRDPEVPPFASGAGCIMAHCVWCPDDELKRMKENGVFVAHCPESNMNLRSGLPPVSKYLDLGLSVGLGSDVAGGTTTSLFSAMRYAITASKLRWRLYDQDTAYLTFPEVFYLATKGGGAFFGDVGSFEEGYEFDAVIIDDFSLSTMHEDLTPELRAERLMYLGDDRNVCGKYVRGRKLY